MYNEPPKKIFKDLKDLYNDIDMCVLKGEEKTKLLEMLYPYVNGEQSLGKCLSKAQSSLEIYLSE